MYRVAATLAAALLACAVGFRVKPKRKSEGTKAATRVPGQVTAMFPMAAPGSATPPLQNARGGPCFPGYRSWTVRKQWFGNEVDLATTVTGVLGYRHPYMSALELDLKKKVQNEFLCTPREGTETPNIPRGLPKIIHDWEFYADAHQGISDLLYNVSNVGIPTSYIYERAEAERMVSAYGWTIVGSAVDNGGSTYIGKQVSHLIQQPQTKECILTFQGSSSTQDWTANFNVKKTHFCGLSRASVACDDDGAGCAAASAGESFVHQGFRDALRAIVQNSAWQSDIKPKLGSCSKLYVTGHSLGGAQTELFTACVQKAPQPGEYGYEEDYKYIEF